MALQSSKLLRTRHYDDNVYYIKLHHPGNAPEWAYGEESQEFQEGELSDRVDDETQQYNEGELSNVEDETQQYNVEMENQWQYNHESGDEYIPSSNDDDE